VLLRTAFEDLPQISKLPDGLERLGLGLCRMATLFLLGTKTRCDRRAGSRPRKHRKISGILEQWAAVSVRSELPVPDYQLGERIVLRSRILGCEIVVTSAIT